VGPKKKTSVQSSLVYLEDFPTAVTVEKSTNDTEIGIRGGGFTKPKHSKDLKVNSSKQNQKFTRDSLMRLDRTTHSVNR
jgi:hypothetical protein